MGEQAASQDLPDTQPVTDSVEDSYEYVLSQEEVHYWARLYPAGPSLRYHDLIAQEINVGRHPSCEVCITESEMSPSLRSIVSKTHFKIIRGSSNLEESTLASVTIIDLSFNGTFVNGLKLEKDKRRLLTHNDVISVGRPDIKVFYYVENYITSQIPYALQQFYHVSRRLGSGAFGEVSLVFSKASGKAYAMKTLIKQQNMTERKLNSEIKKLDNELAILKSVTHPHVIQLIDVVDCVKEKFLILELMMGKDLYDRITSKTKLTEAQAKFYFYQIASGVEYLHSRGIVHRDLKPENVLLADEAMETLVKISDFGLSKVLHSNTYMISLCGTKMYVAPEVLTSNGLEQYTGQVDVWSMGVILYVCLSGSTPFKPGGENLEQQIKRGDYTLTSRSWTFISSAARKLVKRMMTLNPKKRITVSGILEDPWLNDSEMKSKVQKLITPQPLEHLSFSDKENSIPSPIPACLYQPSPPRKRSKMGVDEATTLDMIGQ